MATKKAIDKLHEVVGGQKNKFSDNSASWVVVEDKDFEICFVFDGNGKKLDAIKVAKKVYQCVGQDMITNFKI